MASKQLSTNADEILPSNSARKSFAIQNEDSTDTIYIKKERSENSTVSATDHDWKIGPGGILTLNSMQDGEEAIQARWTGIASANTPRIAVFETENFKR